MEPLKMRGRIMFFHAEFPSGGGERVTRDIARSIQIFGYEVYVVTCNKKRGLAPEVKLLELPHPKVNSIENANAIIDLIHSLSIDIFVLPGFLWDQLKYVKMKVQCKFVYILHNIPLWEVVAKVERRKHTRGSVLKMIEWYFFAYPKIAWFKTYNKRFVRIYREIYELVDAYVVLCDAYKREVKEILNLPTENKIHVIHNSEPAVGNINWNKKRQILFVGNMSYENKRVDRLLEIWSLIHKRVPDWELILVGGGQEKENLQKMVSKRKIQRVTFVGGSNDVQFYYSEASVLCLTSTFEGWPLCLTEAQANGVVPIAFNCCAGVEDILSPSGENGVLVPPFNLEAFAEELYKLLISSDQLSVMRENVVIKSREYDPLVIGMHWRDLFDGLK